MKTQEIKEVIVSDIQEFNKLISKEGVIAVISLEKEAQFGENQREESV